MPTKKWKEENNEKMKEYRKKYYHQNQDSEKSRILKRKRELVEFVRELKKTLKCNRCSESHPATLQFHHMDPKKKLFEVSQAARRGVCKEKILEEISKCEVLCANCHAKEHYTGLV